MKKIWVISDSHCKHRKLQIPNNIDIAIFCGDGSNSRDPAKNLPEIIDFFEWYEELEIPHKIFIAGNHSAAIATNLFSPKEEQKTTTYLEHELIEIENLKIFGSPWTPTFNNWYFGKQRNKLDRLWKYIPDNIDILVTHGPPKGIGDLTRMQDKSLVQKGDKSLLNRIIEIDPIFHTFGHFHNEKGIYNAGIYKGLIPEIGTTFVNASCVDLKYNLINDGFIIYF